MTWFQKMRDERTIGRHESGCLWLTHEWWMSRFILYFFRFEPLGWPFSSWRTRMLHFSGQFAVNVSSFFLVLIGLSNAFTIEKNHTFSANMRKLGVFVWCLRKWQRCSDDFIFFLSFFVIEPLNRSYFFIYIRRENGQLVIDWFWWTQKQLHNVQ